MWAVINPRSIGFSSYIYTLIPRVIPIRITPHALHPRGDRHDKRLNTIQLQGSSGPGFLAFEHGQILQGTCN